MAIRPTDLQHAGQFQRVVARAAHRAFRAEGGFDADRHHHALRLSGEQVDYFFATPDQPQQPEALFPRVRWGGQVIVLNRREEHVRQLAHKYQARCGFALEQGPRVLRVGPLGGLMPFVSQRWHYLVARKVNLLPPGQTTDRFTFHVQLGRFNGGDYAVIKTVPSYGSVMVRLKQRFPDTPYQALAGRARKLVDKIFPVFLTREAAFLRLLQRDLPPKFRSRVPHVLGIERGKDGMVRKLAMNWLRLGTRPITQMQFGLQAAELLRALHDKAHLVHLDLRMDNIVISEEGVCFVDFGSAVRMDEDLSQSPMLHTLFNEMMSTSQIQRLLGRMKESGKVTSQVLVQGHQKIDKAADLFYLAMQISQPHTCPELVPLIEHDPNTQTARRIGRLTKHILRPPDPMHPRHTSAADILRDLKRIDAGQPLPFEQQRAAS